MTLLDLSGKPGEPQFAACDGDGEGGHRGDRRKGSARHVPHRLSEQERQQILTVCNKPQYASLPPAQIVPALADQGEFLASESSFYRVLHAHQQVQRRGRARPPQEPRPRMLTSPGDRAAGAAAEQAALNGLEIPSP